MRWRIGSLWVTTIFEIESIRPVERLEDCQTKNYRDNLPRLDVDMTDLLYSGLAAVTFSSLE